jgi:hypothetical protein
MATEGHERGQRGDRQKKSKAEIDEELAEIRERMEQLTLKIQQETKTRWTYEWPLKRKEKWPVRRLLARKQQQELRKWLRYAENLSDTEEELVCICEPEVGETLSDEEGRSVTGLINCQEGRSELSSCQVGNGRRSVDDLIDCQEGSDGSSSFQVGNEGGSLDLIDYQVGRGGIPECQVGKGEEMNSTESSYQQGVLIDEDSCGFADHVNEDDEKLNTPIAVEEDQRCVLIVGGIQIFLPNSPAETNTRVAHEEVVQQESEKEAMGMNDFKANCVCDAGAAEERQPTRTVKDEEKEQILMSAPTEKEENSDELLTQWEREMKMLGDWLNDPNPGDGCQETVMQISGGEHSTELLKIFSQEAEREITAALEPAAEEEADNIDFVELYEELESLERRIDMQSRHIQQIKLETGRGVYQPGEKLEEVGVEPTQEEMTEANLSEEEAEQQLSDETAELESAAGWKAKATGDEGIKGDQVDLTIDKEEVQQSSLQNKDQPVEQLDEMIEEIRSLMLGSAQEPVSRRRLNRGGPAIAAEKKQQQQQKKQQGKGADEQLQEKVWDPGGSQQHSRGSHEQELMIFPAMGYMIQEGLLFKGNQLLKGWILCWDYQERKEDVIPYLWWWIDFQRWHTLSHARRPVMQHMLQICSLRKL